ncbi:MAG: precorrin-6A reductase [Eubacteriaceae bacterium]|jgi:precorrin-6A/cobalt-precorrin-6A reductase
MILILGGTQDGRELAEMLAAAGEDVCLSSVTEFAGELAFPYENLKIHVGALNEDGIVALAQELHADLIADASHPYARIASDNACTAAKRLGIPRVRLEREHAVFGSDARGYNSDVELAAALSDYLKTHYGNVLFTTGSKSLEAWQCIPIDRQVIRVLPSSGVLEKCESFGYKPSQIIAVQGPFSKEENLDALKKYDICALVTKDSGHTGGTQAKIEAAAEADVPVFYLKRPGYPNTVAADSPEKVFRIIMEKLHRD